MVELSIILATLSNRALCWWFLKYWGSLENKGFIGIFLGWILSILNILISHLTSEYLSIFTLREKIIDGRILSENFYYFRG